MKDFDVEMLQTEGQEQVKKMKTWLFQEQVKIQTRKEELLDISNELQRERIEFEKEKQYFEKQAELQRRQITEDRKLVEKKLKIIQKAYDQLAVDKKLLECDRLNFEHEVNKYHKEKAKIKIEYNQALSIDDGVYFRGVDNELALRKRYKDLLKIFHPDNRCGDAKTLIAIQKEYDQIKNQY